MVSVIFDTYCFGDWPPAVAPLARYAGLPPKAGAEQPVLCFVTLMR